MPKLFLPYHLKKETNNEDYVEVEGSTLREVIENLEKMYPGTKDYLCLLYTSPSPRDGLLSRMPSSA